VPARARRHVRGGEGVARACRVGVDGPRRHVRLAVLRDDRRADRPARHEHLRHTQLAHVPDGGGLLLGELQHVDVTEDASVECAAQLERADLARAHEALPVVEDSPPAREPGERVLIEVAVQQGGHVQPAHAAQQGLGDVAHAPRLADRVDHHRAHARRVVRERERRRLPTALHGDRKPERREPVAERVTVGLAALRDDDRAVAQRMQRTRRMERPAADARRRACNDVTRQMSDHAERGHGPEA
jgi:hypothetical protein